ncbi:hypothetical protein KBC70_02910 [Candidatus Woesebacteria bacterium]|nr:hypothetical protein [Candidatus Woesebacteria bacterium]
MNEMIRIALTIGFLAAAMIFSAKVCFQSISGPETLAAGVAFGGTFAMVFFLMVRFVLLAMAS